MFIMVRLMSDKEIEELKNKVQMLEKGLAGAGSALRSVSILLDEIGNWSRQVKVTPLRSDWRKIQLNVTNLANTLERKQFNQFR